jgi:hypothetical protein
MGFEGLCLGASDQARIVAPQYDKRRLAVNNTKRVTLLEEYFRAVLEAFYGEIEDSQKALASALGSHRKIGVLDYTLGYPVRNLNEDIVCLFATFRHRVTEALIAGLPLGGKDFFLDTSADVFRWSFGNDVNFHVLTEGDDDLPSVQDVPGYMFWGSPACISMRDSDDLILGSDFTHAEICQKAIVARQLLVNLGVPISSTCFGHQLMGDFLGADVLPHGDETIEEGLVGVNIASNACEIRRRFLGNAERNGLLAASNEEKVSGDSLDRERALILMQVGNWVDSMLVILSADAYKFNGDLANNLGIVEGAMQLGRTVSLTSQLHWEFTLFKMIVETALYGVYFQPEQWAFVARETRLQIDFLLKHGNLRA